MQADELLKKPPPWVPPSGGTHRGEAKGLPPPCTPLISFSIFFVNFVNLSKHLKIFSRLIVI